MLFSVKTVINLQPYFKSIAFYILLPLVASLAIYYALFSIISLIQQTQPRTIREAMIGQPHLINPLYADLNPIDKELTFLTFRGLTKFNDKNEVVADLAEKWELSEDGTIYTFYLKPNQTFHDGKPITADDVVFTYTLTQQEEYRGPKRSNFKNVQIEKVNNQQVRFILKEQFAPFLETLNLGVLPKHQLKELPISQLKSHRFNLEPTGSGKFKVEKIELKKLNGLSKITQMNLRSSNLNLIFKFYDTESEALTALMLGEVDTFAATNSSNLALVNQWPSLTITNALLASEEVTLFFNLNSEKIQKNSLRQALSYAIDRTGLPGKSCFSPLPCQSFAYLDEISKYDFDQKKAKELVATLAPEDLEFTLTLLNKPSYQQIGDLLLKNWQAVGFKPKLAAVDNRTLQAIISQRDFEMVLLTQEFPHDPDQYAYWHSTQAESPGLNIVGLENRRVDKALEDARKSLNREERIGYYHQFQKTLTQQLPAIFLFQPNLYYITRKNLGGIKLTNLWYPFDRFAAWTK